MKQGIRDSLNNIQKKSDDLSTKLSDPNITSDINQLTKLNKEYSEIKDVVKTGLGIKNLSNQLMI